MPHSAIKMDLSWKQEHMELWLPLAYIALGLLLVRLLVGLACGTLATKRGAKLRTMIVLGSGGHTAEMMALLGSMNTVAYSPRCYVVAATDHMSQQKADSFEAALAAEAAAAAVPAPADGKTGEGTAAAGPPPPSPGVQTRQAAARLRRGPQQPAARGDKPAGTPTQQAQHAQQQQQAAQLGYQVVRIPRSREVGQSFLTSIWTTLYALWYAVRAVLLFRPAVVLVNGPGTCIPICVAALLARLLGVARGRIFYMESIARVYRLSLTGKILYHARLADRFFVQWPELQERYPRCTYAGRVM